MGTPERMSYIDSKLAAGGIIELRNQNYFTRGPWGASNYVNLVPYSILRGLGIHATRVKLVNPMRITNGKERPDMRLIHAASNTVIEDLTLAGPTVDDGQFYLVTAGIRGWGPTSRIAIRRVGVANIRGTVKPDPMDGLQHEAFGISFDAGYGGHVVEDCIVVGARDGYISAFSGCSGAIEPVIFVRCKADCESGYAAYTLYDHTIVRDCASSLFNYSIYNDTGDLSDAVVEGGLFRSTRVAIGFVGQAGSTKANVRIQGAFFSTCIQGGVGLELVSSTPGAKFRNIDIIGCHFVHLHGSPFTAFSSNAAPADCASITFRDCTFPAGTITNARGVRVGFINCRYENGINVVTLPNP